MAAIFKAFMKVPHSKYRLNQFHEAIVIQMIHTCESSAASIVAPGDGKTFILLAILTYFTNKGKHALGCVINEMLAQQLREYVDCYSPNPELVEIIISVYLEF